MSIMCASLEIPLHCADFNALQYVPCVEGPMTRGHCCELGWWRYDASSGLEQYYVCQIFYSRHS